MNKYPTIFEFRNMADNQRINTVLNNHKNGIIIAARRVKYKYKQIPLEVDDLFNIFIHEIPRIIDTYDEKHNTKISTYILNNAFYIMANYARTHCSGKYKILNERLHIGGEQLRRKMRIDNGYKILTTLSKDIPRMDFSKFNRIELKIMNQYFINDLSVSKISLFHNFSYNKTNRLIKQIKDKVKINNKNLLYL